MKKTERHVAYASLLTLGFLLLLAVYFLFSPRIHEKPGMVYYLSAGTSKKHFIMDLYARGIIRHPSLFYLYTYVHPAEHLKTGEYLFSQGASFFSMWKQVTQGSGLHYRSFSVIPGWSYTQLKQALLNDTHLTPDLTALSDQAAMQALGGVIRVPEGMFFPETYHYTHGNTDKVILKRAYELMQQKLATAWKKRAQGLPYQTPYQALIAASLIEKEAKQPGELPVIAGVLVNRLNKGMLLQFDPTVIYGMGSQYEGKLHREDLQQDTPFNTYVHKGLPPTPIAMPSLLAIEAALHPATHDYLYFVAKGDGSHVFSKSLEEHNIAVTRISGVSQDHPRSETRHSLKETVLPISQGASGT